jgi:hypothetical protein
LFNGSAEAGCADASAEEKAPACLKGTGLEFNEGETLAVSCLTITPMLQCCIGFHAIRFAGFALPFQMGRSSLTLRVLPLLLLKEATAGKAGLPE